ncbi:MAG: tRNA 2-selenouridine(34) synthase MnmH [Bacteroidota bacterium]
MPTPLPPATFLCADGPCLDVRTPAEYAQGHVPEAINLPLFSNEERAQVGTTYKQTGRDEALLLGLELVGPRLHTLVESARAAAPRGTPVRVHCWRGGMRSQSMAQLLEQAGHRAATLAGGYKAFRRHALDVIAQPRVLRVLGGLTGSGKTEVLHALQAAGAQVIDLEGLAHHKGSAFGHIGEAPQPTTQQFENDLAMALAVLDPAQPVWVEDESRLVGHVPVPGALWAQMQEAPVYVIDVPETVRVQRLVTVYSEADRSTLREALENIRRRLGGARTQAALDALAVGDDETACRLALHYYDRAYRHGLARRTCVPVHRLKAVDPHPAALAQALLDHVQGTADAA